MHIPEFIETKIPEVTRGRRPNLMVAKLVKALARLPEEKGVKVTPSMFGWKIKDDLAFMTSLRGALRNSGIRVHIIRSNGSIIVGMVKEDGNGK